MAERRVRSRYIYIYIAIHQHHFPSKSTAIPVRSGSLYIMPCMSLVHHIMLYGYVILTSQHGLKRFLNISSLNQVNGHSSDCMNAYNDSTVCDLCIIHAFIV